MYVALRTTWLLSTLGDEVRLGIVRWLLSAGSASEKEIAFRFSLKQPAASKHLAELTRVGLLHRERQRGPFRIAHPDETEAMLRAARELSRVLVDQDRADEESFWEAP
jgi:DNA-binding transcriptional ArsR family regulator